MPSKKGSQLNFDDRCIIEEMLVEKASFRAIARKLNVSTTTVSHEVKANRYFQVTGTFANTPSSRCVNYPQCRKSKLCGLCKSKAPCCKRCTVTFCHRICPDFTERMCSKLEKAPFVCTVCAKRGACTYKRAWYKASDAQAAHERRLREAHTGISIPQAELKAMVAKVRELLSQGQSLEAIWLTHGDKFPVGVRTFYNYMDKGVMGMANLELPRKVKYAPRKRREQGMPKCDFTGRTYKDWLALDDAKRLATVQMDTILGRKDNGKCILSLHFIRLFFQLFILLPDKTQASVKGALDAVETYCEGEFGRFFPVILTDRGSEFLNPDLIECGIDGQRRTHLYYCDPVRPGQKGAAEKNHVEFRKILPKGSDFDSLSFKDVSLVCSHVNSYPRAGVGVAPIKLGQALLPKNLLECLGIEYIDADKVVMTPLLLK